MLEFVKDNKKVRLWYQFDSSYVDEEYENYDYDDFHYDVDIEDAKETICWELSKIIEREKGSSIILEALDELDSWSCIDWFKIIESCDDLLEEWYKMDAMEYFVENHYELSKDDYDEIQEDGRRCEDD